jgi:hypothetical protein
MKKEQLVELIRSKRKEGKIVFAWAEGLMESSLESAVYDQPVDGLLYDLNRDIVTCLSNLENSNDPVWINNTASGIVIEYLHNELMKYKKLLEEKPEANG